MPYSIPDDDEIRDALENVMKRNKGINSLTKLRKLVIKELQIKNPDYTVSAPRVRKIAVRTPFINTKIEARRADKKGEFKGRCPVCDAKLKMNKNETIYGGTVTLGYRCTECPYWTEMKKRVPTRYRFEYVKK
ncbi:MAG: hypothetical protein ACOCTK_01075 [Candidatus Saliniplasma sp.]